MSPAPLVLAVAAGLAGTVLLAVPVVGPAPSPGLVPPSARVAPAAPAAPSAPPARTARTAAPGQGTPAGGLFGAVPVGRAGPTAGGGDGSLPGARFRWPLSPAPGVLRQFAVGPQPWSPGHRGVDLAGRPGEAVLSAGPGTVTFAGVVAGRGVVAVTHAGGIRTTYEPVTALVTAGEAVAAGAYLGALAAGDHCPATCLHWGALRGDTYLDPLSLLRPPAPPILLPLGRSGR